MAIKKEHKGTHVFIKSCGLVEVNEANEGLLRAKGLDYLFTGAAPEQPEEKPTEAEEIESAYNTALDSMELDELRAMAKEAGIKGRSKMSKNELIEALK